MAQIRNLPDETHRVLKARAALAGMSLSDYLVRALEALAQRLSQEELLGHEAVVSRIWQLRENLGAHDAAYVSLAEASVAPCRPRTRSWPAPRVTVPRS